MSWTRVGLAVLSGVLLIAAFPPLDLGFLGWVALVPLLFAIEGLTAQEAFWVGAVAGFVGFGGILSWIRVFGVPVWILLAAYLALYVGGFCGIYQWAAPGRSPVLRLWLVPLVWVSVEYLRSSGPLGLPWATLGSAQHGLLPVIQIASVGGVFAVSALVALGNAVVASLGRRRSVSLLWPVLLLALVLGWGSYRAHPFPTGPLGIVALQPNVPQREKFAASTAGRNLASLERLVVTASTYHPDVIVFPESAVPVNLFGDGGAIVRVGQWARTAHATVLASSLEDGVSNIAVTVAPSGQALGRYDKVRLVAFGEVGIRPGTRLTPLPLPGGSIGVVICFESIFPDVTRALVRNGADILAVITNDSWFDGTSGLAQHAAHAALRAVETGRWVIRAANTGISMIVDPAGRVVAATAEQQQTILVGRVTPSHTMTFYTRWGNLFAWTVMGAVLLLTAPRWRMALGGEWRVPAFQQVLLAVAVPLVVVAGLIQAGGDAWGWTVLLLVFLGVMSYFSRPMRWGLDFHLTPMVKSLFAGMGVVLGLWALLSLGYRAHDVPIAWPATSAWPMLALRQLGMALVVESWLHGLAFASFDRWKGWPTAVVGTSLAGMGLQIGLSAEALLWAMITGLSFAMIRKWTGNTTGLILPRAVGNILVGLVVLVR